MYACSQVFIIYVLFFLICVFFDFAEELPYLLVCKIKERKKKILATIIKADPKPPFSIGPSPWCREERYFFPRIALLYP